MYVKFPEDKWDKIKKAEQDTKEGRKQYEELKKEFIDKFWNNDDAHVSFEDSAAEIDPYA